MNRIPDNVFSCSMIGVAGTTDVHVHHVQVSRHPEICDVFEARVGIAIMGSDNRQHSDLLKEATSWLKNRSSNRISRHNLMEEATKVARDLIHGFILYDDDALEVWSAVQEDDQLFILEAISAGRKMGCPEGKRPGWLADFYNPFSSRFRDNFARGFGTTPEMAIAAMKADMKATADSLWA